MPIFPFDNPQWSSLSYADPLAVGGWGFPDNVGIGSLLDLSHTRIAAVSDQPVGDLRLSTRPGNALSASGITTLGQLLGQTLSDLLALPNMGRTSILEVIGAVLHFTSARAVGQSFFPKSALSPADFYRLIDGKMLEPLPLQREWQLFSGLASCSDSLPVSALDLPEPLIQQLADCTISSVADLLGLTWGDLDERVGMDASEEILSALTTLAVEIGHGHHATQYQADLDVTRDSASILAERWKNVPVTQIDFVFSETSRALRRAHVQTISDLLVALDPLHPELYLDLYAFADVWGQLGQLGLVSGSLLAERDRRSEWTRTTTSLDNVLKIWRESMKPNEWKVLNGRYGLERSEGAGENGAEEQESRQPRTLEELGTEIGVSQERIRQMLIATVKRLKTSRDDYLIALANALQFYTMSAGGVISLGDASRWMANLVNPGCTRPEGLCRLVFDVSDAFVSIKRNAVYGLSFAPTTQYDRVVRQAYALQRESDAGLEVEALAEAVTAALFPPTGDSEADAELPTRDFVLGCLNADGGLENERTLPTDTLLVRLLRQLGSPRHFTEITTRLNETGWRRKNASTDYIHGQLLSRRDLFVHASRGTYGLAEWGLEDQRTDRTGAQIPDLIIEFLEECGVPAPREEIVAYVLSQKKCRDYSVMHRLFYDDRFCEFDKHTYGLARWTF